MTLFTVFRSFHSPSEPSVSTVSSCPAGPARVPNVPIWLLSEANVPCHVATILGCGRGVLIRKILGLAGILGYNKLIGLGYQLLRTNE